jgi:hypothetical protein
MDESMNMMGDGAEILIQKCPPVEDGGEYEYDGDGAERVELGEEGGRLEVDEREEEEDEEEGHSRELTPHQVHRTRTLCTKPHHSIHT